MDFCIVMKITPKQYVSILNWMMEKYPNDKVEVSKRFIFLLRRNHNVGLLPKIKRLYREYLEKKHDQEMVQLQSARSFSSSEKSEIEKVIRTTRKNVTVEWKENPTLKGGAYISFGEKGYDESIARRFRALKQFF